MSHSFYLEKVDSPLLSAITDKMGGEEIKFIDGYPSPEDNRWPDGTTCIYHEKKSARALEVDYNGSTFQVRIFAASSPYDYKFAIKLVTAISRLSDADIEPEDNMKMSLPEFIKTYDSNWIKEHCTTSLSMVIGHHVNEPETTGQITGVGKTMTLGPRVVGQLMEHKPNIAQEFFNRMKKLNYLHLEDIYHSMITVFGNDTGDKNVRVSTYTEGVPTLLCDKNTLVALTSNQDLEEENSKTKVIVPLYKLPDIIGEKAIWLSEELLLVPGVEGDAWKSFVDKARAVHVEDIFDFGFDPNNDPFASDDMDTTRVGRTGDLTEEELKVLSYAPMVVFCVVAAADGNIDKKEIEAFQKELVKGVLTDSEVLLKATVYAIAEFEVMIAKLLSQEISVQEKLVEIANILNSRLPLEESNNFKSSLISLGETVASASGGFLGIFGSKIDKKEKQALSVLKTVLGVSE